MNTVSLIGRFVKDPELRYTPSGTAVSNFTLAVRNPFDKDGNADFIQCVTWGSGAELIAEKHQKGNMVGVDGRIQTRNYENSEGQIVYVTEVNVNSIHLIQSKDYSDNKNDSDSGNNKGNGNANKGNSSSNRGNNNNNGNSNSNRSNSGNTNNSNKGNNKNNNNNRGNRGNN